MCTKIPEYEVSWLLGMDSTYKVFKNSSLEAVYPVAILPPKLKKFVKSVDVSTDFVNLGPYGHSDTEESDGVQWRIWGWKELPSSAGTQNEDWSRVILAERERPSIVDLQCKIKHIQAELSDLTNLVARL